MVWMRGNSGVDGIGNPGMDLLYLWTGIDVVLVDFLFSYPCVVCLFHSTFILLFQRRERREAKKLVLVDIESVCLCGLD